MKDRAQQIQNILEASFHPTHLNIEDESWKHAGHAGAKEQGGGHFCVDIASDHFAGKSRVECHREINKALEELFGPIIHALTIRVHAPKV